jgi:predicted nucleic acid-binding protein
MIHSVQFTCVLDTNVIHPLYKRDLLFWFAHAELYNPKWSKHIFLEWHNILERQNLQPQEIEKRINKAHRAFPDAMVNNYEKLISKLELPDEKDRHVLAAAIKTNANLIVTENLKDFPNDYLSSFGLSSKSCDDFLTDLIDLNPDTAISAFRKMVLHKRNPDLDEYEVLNVLRNNGLKETADYLHSQL